MQVSEKQRRLVEDFAFIEDRQERLAAVVDRARQRPRLPEAERTDAQLVPGCTSRVWLVGECEGDVCRFRADCDSPLVKGLVALLVDIYDGASRKEVVATEPTVLAELDLLRDLSPTRQNGLAAVRRRIVELAR
ncbi:MAG TPA: SufE family protein [Candidatus Synoicihabitans sp.]|nr:SufE family protein [Candidatus Synoicihabitans sp.]